MHTYRDALGLRACLVVYPGRQADPAPFYATDGTVHRDWSLARLLADATFAGVGALPLSPEDPPGRPAPAP